MNRHVGDSPQWVQGDTSKSADAVSTLGGLNYKAYCEGEVRWEMAKKDGGGGRINFIVYLLPGK